MILTLVLALAKAYRETKGRKDAGKQLDAVIHAIEETAHKHPEAMGVVKRVVRDKATKLGVNLKLHEKAQAVTDRLKREADLLETKGDA